MAEFLEEAEHAEPLRKENEVVKQALPGAVMKRRRLNTPEEELGALKENRLKEEEERVEKRVRKGDKDWKPQWWTSSSSHVTLLASHVRHRRPLVETFISAQS